MNSNIILKGVDLNQKSFVELKDLLKSKLNETLNGYVEIGYILKNMDERKLYLDEGYQDIQDFAFSTFGIDKTRTGRLIQIVKRFTLNGNEPVLLPQWQEFSISKLQELLPLDDNTIKNVTPSTTVKQIRVMKSKNKNHETPNVDKSLESISLKSDWEAGVFEDDMEPYGSLRSTALHDAIMVMLKLEIKEINEPFRCNAFGYVYEVKNSDGYIEFYLNNNLSFKTSKKRFSREYEYFRSQEQQNFLKISQQKPIHESINSHFCEDFGYECNLNERREIAVDAGMKCEAACCCTCDEVGMCGCRCLVAMDKLSKQTIKEDEPEIIDVDYKEVETKGEKEKKIIQDLIKTEEETINTMKDYWEKDRPDTLLKEETKLHAYKKLLRNMESINQVVPSIIGLMDDPYCPTCGKPLTYRCDCECGQKIDWSSLTSLFDYEEEQIQKRIDNIVKERIKSTPSNSLHLVEQPDASDQVMKMINTAIKFYNDNDWSSADFYLFHARKDLFEDVSKEYERDNAPHYHDWMNRRSGVLIKGLPSLKNNDQRKEWLENYSNWPVWIDLPETGEKYYRFDLSDDESIVVKVSRKHSFDKYKETKNFEYGAEEYYLLGVKSEWHSNGSIYVLDPSRTFYECKTNKSSLVDYLKDFQKNNK